MCGIAGIHDPLRPRPADELQRLAATMARTLLHRGPDEGQSWAERRSDGTSGTAFGFQRLAIQDVSPGGRQPMTSASGRATIAYNGEIYSSAEVRAHLGASAPAWRGHSDTEVLLEACEALGVEATLPLLIGMFAFAFFEHDTRRLWLVRDRLGIKPLYWAPWGDGIAFGSELRALRVVPGVNADIDRDALAAYARHGYVAPSAHRLSRRAASSRLAMSLCAEPGKPCASDPIGRSNSRCALAARPPSQAATRTRPMPWKRCSRTP